MKCATEFQEFFSTQSIYVPKPVQKWKKPASGYLKLNFDGAFFESTSSGGWGFIFRVHDGDHMGSGAGQLSPVREAIHTEAKACLQAVHFAIQSGMHMIELETDCIALKDALTYNAYDASNGGLSFREIRFPLQHHQPPPAPPPTEHAATAGAPEAAALPTLSSRSARPLLRRQPPQDRSDSGGLRGPLLCRRLRWRG
ncbi:hypothetical protein HU200_026933 [Digitaria exilis]|uniref:RNase H type-1 domain-containing protein n=1 Tax=Digitaria exilis TaxID=1010633 RepID=A0A835C058_9POAL|nr:hypothetical protein HU200_026933 [Digitaria exilis]